MGTTSTNRIESTETFQFLSTKVHRLNKNRTRKNDS